MAEAVQALEGLSLEAQNNLEIGKQKKSKGDAAFKVGDVKAALRLYHEALLYFKGLNRNNPATAPADGQDKPKTELDVLLEKVYANMSACHLKQGNWQRTVETAEKAIAINKDNLKALFRKGKALGEQGYFEKAEVILEDLLQRNTDDARAIAAELSQLRAKDKEREKRNNQKFKGFLSRKGDILSPDNDKPSDTTSPADDGPAPSATIEEVAETDDNKTTSS